MIMREQLKAWFQSVQLRETNIEMHLEESEQKTEIAIIGKKHAASVEMVNEGTCDLSLVDVVKDEIVSFKSTTFTNSESLFGELDQLLLKID